MRFEVRFFSKPNLSVDGQVTVVALKRSEAILYYVAYEKRVTREELVRLIWPEIDSVTAKKNLRNSLYRLKKDLGFEPFFYPTKSVIDFDPQLDLFVDVLSEGVDFLRTYKGKFLEHFTLKESEAFDRWRTEIERDLNQKYLKLAGPYIEACIKDQRYEVALEITKVMFKIDDYNEHTARLLMQLYHALGQTRKITDVYVGLKKALDEELGIQPDKLTRDFYYQLMYTPMETLNTTRGFYGRVDELKQIHAQLSGLVYKGKSKSIIVMGEAGVGKSKLIEIALDPFLKDIEVLSMNGYADDSGYAYKAWNDVFVKLSEWIKADGVSISDGVSQMLVKFFPGFDPAYTRQTMENSESLNLDFVERSVVALFKSVLENRKVLLVIEDLQWVDAPSLKLLQNLVLHVEGFTFIASLRNESAPSIDVFISQLVKYDRLCLIELSRFSREETYALIQSLSEQALDDMQKQKIFEASEGNAFFIVEGTAAIHQDLEAKTLRVKGILDSRFYGLDANVMKLLVIIAMFFDGIDYEMLLKLYAVDEDVLLEYLQQLREKFLIKEVESEAQVKFMFTHHKLREHIYEETTLVKKKVLHNRIGLLLEETLEGGHKDVLVYQKLIYHYKHSGNTRKHLYFYLKYLKTYFDFSHELYPELAFYSPPVLERQPEDYFLELETLIAKLGDESDALVVEYDHMKARYLIRSGAYAQGMVLIKKVIASSSAVQDHEMLFKAYVQWFYYLIQTERTEEMDAVLQAMDGPDLSDKSKAVLLRLKGIFALMTERYNEAILYFEASIGIFERLGDRNQYVLNIAAAHNYISEAHRRQGAYDLALEVVKRAIALCSDYNIIRGISIFNTNAGIIAYKKGDWELARDYFIKALKNFDAVDTLWRRSEAEGYLGLIEVKYGVRETGLSYLEQAKAHANAIGTPETITLIQSLDNEARNGYDYKTKL